MDWEEVDDGGTGCCIPLAGGAKTRQQKKEGEKKEMGYFHLQIVLFISRTAGVCDLDGEKLVIWGASGE